MHICILGHADYEIVRRRAERYARRGHEVDVVTYRPGDVADCTVNQITSPWAGAFQYLFGLPKIWRVINSIEPDIVDAHSVISYGLTLLLPLKQPAVVTAYGPDLYGAHMSHPYVRFFARRVLQRADSIIASTPQINTYLQRLGVHDLPQVHVRPGGIPISRIRTSAQSRREKVRRQQGISPGTPVILHSRRIDRLWRVRTVMDAVRRLREEGFDCRLWWVYPPPSGKNQELLSSLKDMAAVGALTDSVCFMGELPYDDLIDVMHASDIYVSVGKDDFLAASVQEAACAGLIPVLSDLPAYRSLFSEENAKLIGKVSTETLFAELADAIVHLEALRNSFSKTSLLKLRSDHDIEDGIDWLLSVYKSVLSS